MNRNLNTCFKLFKNQINHNLNLFSYPEGQSKDFNKTIIKNLKKRGIKICPTAINGFNSITVDPFKLRRIQV